MRCAVPALVGWRVKHILDTSISSCSNSPNPLLPERAAKARIRSASAAKLNLSPALISSTSSGGAQRVDIYVARLPWGKHHRPPSPLCMISNLLSLNEYLVTVHSVRSGACGGSIFFHLAPCHARSPEANTNCAAAITLDTAP